MKRIVLYFVLSITSIQLLAQNGEIRKKHFNLKKNVAIQGYDPVSYFDHDPKKGDMNISYKYNGILYYFSSQSNLEAFKKAPERYEPQYGGWCAYAIGKTGDKVKIDPTTYKIIDDKLYLFYNFRGTNTLDSWNKEEQSLKNKGDRNWHQLVNDK
ncbi:YHS domain-containing protein [Fulvivirga sp. M361]|uniref:YHS domain-containing (seleno)protein n=1 Tax=Fulvivirga sp. M361 TaxID=2594266 RepID=UPI00117B1CF6|nr:YHS domain-containing (seleno)protein [Fulvivirga sp. M361]TRX50425.1 YHS domain-containing protein [Fulvivirga sp. M361]